MFVLKKLSAALSVFLTAACAWATPTVAQELSFSELSHLTSSQRTATYYGWMHPEVSSAWKETLGVGATITVVDNFTGDTTYLGNLGDGSQRLRHGEWTLKEAGMIAPHSTVTDHDFYSGQAVALTEGFDVLNLSYGMVGAAGQTAIDWSAQERSIIDAARGNLAFVSKAAGNDYRTAIGQPNGSGRVDYLARDLIGAPGAVFVGALERNGTVKSPARLATYSNIAGTDATVQAQFLVVGVDSGRTGLAGTSFAAPIVSGYAGLLSQKFGTDSPERIGDRLLLTAREDTIAGYRRSIHGEGEASISRALAPNAIE